MATDKQNQQGAQGRSQATQAAQNPQAAPEGTARPGQDLGNSTAAGGNVAVEAGAQQPAVTRQAQDQARTGVLRPPVDVIEDALGITLLADMPGVSRENLNLRLDSQSLTIEGALQLDGPQQMDSRYAEIRHQHYERTFALSRELDGEKATAELANGVLKVRIPKTAHATPRKIPVNVAAS